MVRGRASAAVAGGPRRARARRARQAPVAHRRSRRPAPGRGGLGPARAAAGARRPRPARHELGGRRVGGAPKARGPADLRHAGPPGRRRLVAGRPPAARARAAGRPVAVPARRRPRPRDRGDAGGTPLRRHAARRRLVLLSAATPTLVRPPS